MQQYFFVLGRNPTLSVTEIISVLHHQQINYFVSYLSAEIFIVSSDKILDAQALMKVLGGTVKLGRIIDEVSLDDSESEFIQVFSAENLIDNYLSKREGKLHIGVSIYNCGGNSQYVAKLTDLLKDLNITIKENLRKEGLKAGFVRVKDRFLSSVSVAKNQLINKGIEIVLILTDKKIIIGKTLAVQEFDSFSFRDYGRPERDKRSGIIPPKLARIMINLGEVNKSATILDPFCGSGTIVQEAIILGYSNIIGSDVSAKAISHTKRNIDWLFQNFTHLSRSSYNIKIIQADVRTVIKHIPQCAIDAIITEPYLGPPLYKRPDFRTIKKTLFGLTSLYVDAFIQCFKLLKPGGKIIIIFPIIEEKGKIHFVEILDKIKKLGFAQENFLTESIKKHPVFQLSTRNTILYGHREQFVKREILSFQKM